MPIDWSILPGTYVYKIRKVGKLWRLYHRHWDASLNVNEEHVVAESSIWSMLAWMATGDPAYAQPGWVLRSKPCESR